MNNAIGFKRKANIISSCLNCVSDIRKQKEQLQEVRKKDNTNENKKQFLFPGTETQGEEMLFIHSTLKGFVSVI